LLEHGRFLLLLTFVIVMFALLFFQYNYVSYVHAQDLAIDERNQTNNKLTGGNNDGASRVISSQIAAAAAISGAIVTGLFTLINQRNSMALYNKDKVRS
jgi:uncharacterized membrane protein